MPGQFPAEGAGLDVLSSGSPASWENMANVVSYDLGAFQNVPIDVGHLKSGNAREYRRGPHELPQASLVIHLDPSNARQQQLWADVTDTDPVLLSRSYRLRLGPSATPYFVIEAFVSTYQIVGTSEDFVTVNLGLQHVALPTATWA